MSEKGYSIQRFRPEDVESAASSFASYNKRRSMYKEFISEQQAGRRISFSATIDGVVVGYTNILWESGYVPFKAHRIPEINNMHVLDPHQGKGIGSALIKTAEEEALSQGCHMVGIGVGLTEGYARAQRLYPKLGYVPDGRGEYEDEYDGVTYLIKQLIPSGTKFS
ncbi:MAG: GNAT family N-acetyltransferase [Candidatus Latescibacteria bacterium]|nr:GNAT family N-acetyltransferase [Candidatus Latescibacterota bacterium]